jgi:hypothetical protein
MGSEITTDDAIEERIEGQQAIKAVNRVNNPSSSSGMMLYYVNQGPSTVCLFRNVSLKGKASDFFL